MIVRNIDQIKRIISDENGGHIAHAEGKNQEITSDTYILCHDGAIRNLYQAIITREKIAIDHVQTEEESATHEENDQISTFY